MPSSKQFVKNDCSFVCVNCGARVEKLGSSSRDHCNKCLASLHVDINPGDRANNCKGELEPVNLEISGKKGYIIVYKCRKCNQIVRNRAAHDDDFDALLALSASNILRN